jgi:hypothetical protein
MPVDVTNTLKDALAKLTAEKQRIERQAAAIQEALRAVNGSQPSVGARVAMTRGAKRGRRRMSPAQRRAVALRMKAYWAKRRSVASKRKRKAA